MKKILLLDLCGTIYKSNTTFDFLFFYLSGWRRFLFKYVFLNLASRVFCKFVFKFSGFDLLRYLCIYLLKGETYSNLQKASLIFLRSLQMIEPVKDYLEKERSNFDDVIIISASLDFIVHSSALIHQADGFFSSELNYYFSNKICDGRFIKDIFLCKHNIIEERFSGDSITFITDNYNDKGCIIFCNEFIAVVEKNDKKAIDFWKSQGVSNVIKY